MRSPWQKLSGQEIRGKLGRGDGAFVVGYHTTAAIHLSDRHDSDR